jgi:hypothetical protein
MDENCSELAFFYNVMKNELKQAQVHIRVSNAQKYEWLKIAEEKKTNITDLIVSSVENKILNSDRKEIMTFIERQGNIFAKIENNINQIARVVNTEKNISNGLLEHYNKKLSELNVLKLEQKDLLKKIYNLLHK